MKEATRGVQKVGMGKKREVRGPRLFSGQWSVVTDGQAERAGETPKEAQGGEGECTFKNDTTSVPPKVPVNYKLQVTRDCFVYGAVL